MEDEVDMAHNMHGREEKYIQSFCRKNAKKRTIWKTYTKINY
jgi:hypothetical protein